MNKKLILFFLLLMLSGQFSSAQDSLMTVDKAIELILKNNFSITISRNQSDIAKNNNTAGNAGELPQLSLNATGSSASNNIKQVYSTGTDFSKNDVLSNNLNAYASLNWTIFDGLNMFALKSQYQELEAQGDLNLKIQIENTIEQTIQIYFNIVQQQQLVKALNEEIAVSEERAKIADRKFSNGSGSKLDLLQAKVDLNAQRSALMKQQTALEESKVNLNQLLARSLDTRFGVADTVIISYHPSYDQLNTSVFQRNNELQFTEKNIHLSQLNLKEIQSLRYPRISLTGNYVFSKVDNQAGFTLLNQNQGFNYGFTATMPLFNGFTSSTGAGSGYSIHSAVKNAKLGILNSQLQFDQTKLVIESSLMNVYREFEDNKQVLKLEEENIQYARESMNIALERFRVGLSTFVDFKVAQTGFEDAMSRLVAARYNTKVSETALMRLNGYLVK